MARSPNGGRENRVVGRLLVAALVAWLITSRRRRSGRPPMHPIAPPRDDGTRHPLNHAPADQRDSLRWWQPRPAWLLVFGLLLAAVATWVTWFVESDRSQTTLPVASVALATDPSFLTRLQAPTVDATVTVHPGLLNCGSAHVRIVYAFRERSFFETSVWKAARQQHRSAIARFGVAVVARGTLRHLTIQMTDSGYTFNAGKPPIAKSFPQKDILKTKPRRVSYESGGRFDTYSVSGAIRKWDRHRDTIDVAFDAPWVERRGFGTCYVALPALLGTNNNDAATEATFALKDAGGKALTTFAGDWIASSGQNHLIIEGGVLSGSPVSSRADTGPAPFRSPPAQPASDPENGLWSCDVPSSSLPPKLLYLVDLNSDCHSFVTVSAGEAGNLKTFLPFVFGALFALALQMIFEFGRSKLLQPRPHITS
jgi:hypothetical protein